MATENKSLDKTAYDVVEVVLDSQPRIVLAKPDIETIKQARRWLRGAAMLLEDASNGNELIVAIAAEAAVLANMADIAIFDQEL